MKAKDLTRYVQAAIIATIEYNGTNLINCRIKSYAQIDGVTCDVTLEETGKEINNQLERIKYLFGVFE